MEYNIENIRQLYLDGLTQSQIAKELNATTAQIAGKIKRGRAKDPSMFPLRNAVPVKEIVVKEVKIKPNRYTIFTKPSKYVHKSKAELRDELYRAVLNTK